LILSRKLSGHFNETLRSCFVEQSVQNRTTNDQRLESKSRKSSQKPTHFFSRSVLFPLVFSFFFPFFFLITQFLLRSRYRWFHAGGFLFLDLARFHYPKVRRCSGWFLGLILRLAGKPPPRCFPGKVAILPLQPFTMSGIERILCVRVHPSANQRWSAGELE